VNQPKPELARGRRRLMIEPSNKRVRTYLHGQLVADTTRPLLVWEKPYYPTYYLPVADVAAQLVGTGRTDRTPRLGEVEVLDVVAGDAAAPAAAGRLLDPPDARLRETVRLEWSAMSQWLEEDEPVYVHPRDPYTRIDILASSRHVRIELDQLVLAESGKPTILFETGLPPRLYLPPADVRLDLLRPTERRTGCPYKGTASYWTVEINGKPYADLVWSYPTPLPESQKIAGLLCFYDERVDLYLDGQRQERPRTPFSQPPTS
jgi:uncharacterized protein (DUF427 family)